MTAETLLRGIQIALIVSGFVTAGLSAAAWRLSVHVNAANNREVNDQIAAAEARVDEANAVASQARRELAEFTEPRAIRPDDREKITATLKQFAGQKLGFSVFGDPEYLSLLRTLDATLKSAGWVRVPSQIGVLEVDAAGDTAGVSHDSGVAAFIGPDNAEAEGVLLALSEALTGAGIPCQPSQTDQLRGKVPKAITINVGKKPA